MFAPELLAIAAAFCAALSVMLADALNGRVDVIRLSRWTLIAVVLMTAPVSAALGGWRMLDGTQFALLAGSSLAGIGIGLPTYYGAVYLAGPRASALCFSLTAPFALLFGYGLFGETITALQGSGVALVLGGIVLAVGMPAAATGGSRAVPWLGLAFGAIAALCQAASALLARPVMAAGIDPFTAMAVRSGLGAVLFVALQAVPFTRAGTGYRFIPGDLWITVASAFFGTGLGMVLLMAALAHGAVGIVTTLTFTTPIMILPMVWLRSGVPPSRVAWAGAGLAVIGTSLISVK